MGASATLSRRGGAAYRRCRFVCRRFCPYCPQKEVGRNTPAMHTNHKDNPTMAVILCQAASSHEAVRRRAPSSLPLPLPPLPSLPPALLPLLPPPPTTTPASSLTATPSSMEEESTGGVTRHSPGGVQRGGVATYAPPNAPFPSGPFTLLSFCPASLSALSVWARPLLTAGVCVATPPQALNMGPSGHLLNTIIHNTHQRVPLRPMAFEQKQVVVISQCCS